MPHIVDTLIEERAAKLMRNPRLWRVVKKLTYPLLGYPEALRMADTIHSMDALAVFTHLSDTLRMNVRSSGRANIPASGSAIVMLNHPAGIADGVAVFDALKSIRQDIVFFANRDAIRVAPGLTDMIVPVEWVDEQRTHQRRRETVRYIVRAFRDQRLVVIFPSGRLARPTLRGLVERQWQPTAANLAVKYQCPVIPAHIAGRNSALFYLFCVLNDELRDMTLFRELLNKRHQSYQLTFTRPFRMQGDVETQTRLLREFVESGIPSGAVAFEPPHSTVDVARPQATVASQDN